MKTTTENNKIIAEFMGLEITKDKVIVPEMFQVEEHPFHLLKWIDDFREVDNLPPNSLNNLHFNSDWNWLMKVVEKIEMHGFTFEIKKNWSCITRKGEKIILRWEDDKTKIEAVYNACIAFIDWYNSAGKIKKQ